MIRYLERGVAYWQRTRVVCRAIVLHATASDAFAAAATAERDHEDHHRRSLLRESIRWRKTANQTLVNNSRAWESAQGTGPPA